MHEQTWALITLAVGICTVLGMIILLKVNAFISLITAAIVVSIMAPGDIGSKLDRVAKEFGGSAQNIGIVIALAAVIGQCMMESGAADRIVRAFMNVLGERRAPAALMGSGFVLAVPVFFDTVFYLLVPLARSLYRRTRANYLLYVLAICAGGAITHTLVPPTPGPLVMADQLGIDVGLMILIGGLVAIPSAFSGLAISGAINRRMPITPPSSVIGQTDESGQSAGDQPLPGLLVSLLPVLLPVVMISANTAASAIADAERAARLNQSDIEDWDRLRTDLESTDPGRYVLSVMKLEKVPALTDEGSRAEFLGNLNRAIGSKTFFEPGKADRGARDFASALPPEWQVSEELAALDAARGSGSAELAPAAAESKARLSSLKIIRSLAAKDSNRMKQVERERMNRLLLESAFPASIRRHIWETPRRRTANLFQLLGNANLSLLLSTAVAIFVWWNTRRPSLTKIAHSIEESLMSGGAIILITAAGGAFGAMLNEAGVGAAIMGMFGTSGSEVTPAIPSILLLLIGFGIAALMKVAQGSSTTSMIVTSAMMASVIANTNLTFNAVYLATAIGSGSLVGSWMNDSGFWIVARMSGLTEGQALKAWTPLLLVLAFTGLICTIALTLVLPLKV